MPRAIIRGRLTSFERAEVERLALTGFKAHAIAAQLKRHPATINFAMIGMGLRAGPKYRRTDSYVRKGSTVTPFCAEEDRMIEDRRTEGWSYRQIADACWCLFGVRRSAATVGIRLKMLACEDTAA